MRTSAFLLAASLALSCGGSTPTGSGLTPNDGDDDGIDGTEGTLSKCASPSWSIAACVGVPVEPVWPASSLMVLGQVPADVSRCSAWLPAGESAARTLLEAPGTIAWEMQQEGGGLWFVMANLGTTPDLQPGDVVDVAVTSSYGIGGWLVVQRPDALSFAVLDSQSVDVPGLPDLRIQAGEAECSALACGTRSSVIVRANGEAVELATDERGGMGELEFVNDFYEPVLSCPGGVDYHDSFVIAAYGSKR